MDTTDARSYGSNGADEVLAAARRIFGVEDRYGGDWLDHTRLQGRTSVFVCAVKPTQDEIESLDRDAERAGLPLTVIPVEFSYADLLGFDESISGSLRASNLFVSFGMDSVHNALCLRLRALDEEAIAYFRARIPTGALRIEIEPRAGHAVAA
jgi:hypothetical protein